MVLPQVIEGEINQGQFQVAHGNLVAILQRYPQSDKAWYLMAWDEERLGDLSNARKAFTVAESLNPAMTMADPKQVALLRTKLSLDDATASRSAIKFGGIALVAALCVVLATMYTMRRRKLACLSPVPGVSEPATSIISVDS
jgi:tetratricopeptide (TPR) repeat protein